MDTPPVLQASQPLTKPHIRLTSIGGAPVQKIADARGPLTVYIPPAYQNNLLVRFGQ